VTAHPVQRPDLLFGGRGRISNLRASSSTHPGYRQDCAGWNTATSATPRCAPGWSGPPSEQRGQGSRSRSSCIQGDERPPLPQRSRTDGDGVKRRSVRVWYLMAKDEGHGFRKKGNQDFQFYATILFTRALPAGTGRISHPVTVGAWWSGWPRSPGANTCSAGSCGGWSRTPARCGRTSWSSARATPRSAWPTAARCANHLKLDPCVALANLAEVTSGLAVTTACRPARRGIPTTLSITYLKRRAAR